MSRLSQSLRRFSHNIAAGTLLQIINLCAQIISVPLFLHYWSKPAYGEWLVLTSIPSLLWCFEGGLAGVAASRMTVAAAAENWHLANVLFQNVLLAQSILCAFILAGCLLFVHLVDISHLLQFSHTTNSEASEVLVLMICYMIIGFFINLLRAAYRASALEARGVMVFNLWRVTDLSVTVLVLKCHGHVVPLAAGMASSAAFCLMVACFDARRSCPRFYFQVREASWTQIKGLMIDGTPLLIGMAASALFLQGYPLVVNRTMGASMVVNLNVVRTVSRTVLHAILLITASSAAELSRTYGGKDTLGYLRLLKIIVAGSLLGGLLSCTGMPLLGPWIIREWTGGKISMDSFTLLLFGISVALQGAWDLCGTVLVASNMHHIFNYLYFSVTVMALLVTSFFVIPFGFTAIPVVMICADLSLLIAGIYLCHKKLKHISLRELYCVFQPAFYFQKVAEFRKKSG